MKINSLGTYKFVNRTTIKPDKHCLNCILFDDVLGWCKYLKIKIDDCEYYELCPVSAIIIEE
jgi:hypothetical protein